MLAWLTRNIILELRDKKKVYGHWKQGQTARTTGMLFAFVGRKFVGQNLIEAVEVCGKQ